MAMNILYKRQIYVFILKRFVITLHFYGVKQRFLYIICIMPLL